MNKLFVGLFVSLVLLCPVNASAVLIDFESFANGENINGINLEGVTLTSPGNGGKIEVFENRLGVFFKSPTKAIGNFVNNKGSLENVPLIGQFDQAVSYVSLWAGDAGGIGDFDSWMLNLFDARQGGNLLASLSSTVWRGSPYTQLEFSADNIYRFEAVWTGPGCCGVGFDELQFDFAVRVPSPGTLVLVGLGLLMIASCFGDSVTNRPNRS